MSNWTQLIKKKSDSDIKWMYESSQKTEPFTIVLPVSITILILAPLPEWLYKRQKRIMLAEF